MRLSSNSSLLARYTSKSAVNRKKVKFNLDTPVNNELTRLTRFSGWCFATDDVVFRGITLTVDENPFVFLTPVQRLDVADVYPDFDTSICAGFVGDLIVPNWVEFGALLTIGLTACFADGTEVLVFNREFILKEEPLFFRERQRSFQLVDVLEGPENQNISKIQHLKSVDCWDASRQLLAGTPHFHPSGNLPIIRMLDAGPTHDYGKRALELINALPEASLFLDLGSGIKSDAQLFDNAVYLDAVHFANVDVVNTCTKLPFRDSSFDLVISQAVFEHLPSPFQMAKEVFRVLKPGGIVLIDTAFMQPLHGDPDHYFNMTLEGLRLVLEDFEILEIGIQPHQYPSFGLKMQFNAVLPFMKNGLWKTRLTDFLDDLEKMGTQLDEDLGLIGRLTISAGVFAVARKPE